MAQERAAWEDDFKSNQNIRQTEDKIIGRLWF